MPLTALFLVIAAAFSHSVWNLLAKRASSHTHFLWFTAIGESVLLLPLVIWAASTEGSPLGWQAAVCLASSGALELLYAQSLMQGYRVGELSVVYPVARGMGSVLACLGAITILREPRSFGVVAGAVLVSAGIWLLSTWATGKKSWPGLYWGAFTGLAIAGYTLVDGYAIRTLLLSPFLVGYAGNLVRSISLSAAAWQDRTGLTSEFRQCWKEVLGVAALTPASYILVLFAMRMAPVSHVAPAREVSMVISAYFGSWLLNEGHLVHRVSGSLLIVLGVIALTLG